MLTVELYGRYEMQVTIEPPHDLFDAGLMLGPNGLIREPLGLIGGNGDAEWHQIAREFDAIDTWCRLRTPDLELLEFFWAAGRLSKPIRHLSEQEREEAYRENPRLRPRR